MGTHVARIAGAALLIALGVVYPFLPGQFDALAVPLSILVQAFGALGLMLIPAGGLWLAYEVTKRGRVSKGTTVIPRAARYAVASLAVATLIALALAGVALAVVGWSFAALVLAAWAYVLRRLVPRVRQLKVAEGDRINPAPLYLVLVPALTLILQLALAAPLTAFSRQRAIVNSGELIADIEAYHTRNGAYPAALSAVHKDYYPSIVGVEKFHYMPRGEGYSLYFEQPRFLLDNPGTREFVVYNPRNQHAMISHTAWILSLGPERVESAQGWHSVHEASTPHWKFFWFD